MGGVFERFQEEEHMKMMKLGGKIFRMFKSGESVAEIAKQTNLTEEFIKEMVAIIEEEF